MGNRLVKWFSLNVFFALTPLVAVIVVRTIANKLSFDDLTNNSLEVLFFAFMISVTTLSDLEELGGAAQKITVIYTTRYFLLITSTWLALIYGVSLLDTIMELNLSGFRYRVFLFAAGYSIVVFLVGVIIQVYIFKLIAVNTPPRNSP